MAQASAQVSLSLLVAIALDGPGAGGAILVPVTRVIGAPLPGAIAADLAILWIQGELALAVLVAAPTLARLGRAHRLFWMESRRRELLLAERATPLLHPPRVNSLYKENSPGKEQHLLIFGCATNPIGRLSAT